MTKSTKPMVKNEKLVATHVTIATSNRLGLLSIYRRESRADMVKGLIEAMLNEEETPNTMMSVIARRTVDEWINGGRQISFPNYVKQTWDSLMKKRIAREYVEAIIEKMKEYNEADKSKHKAK